MNLKVSFKNIDHFKKYKALKSKIIKKAQFHKENGIQKQFSTSKLCISLQISTSHYDCITAKKLSWLQLKAIKSTATAMNSKIYSFDLMYKQATTISSWNYKLKVVKWSQLGKSKK